MRFAHGDRNGSFNTFALNHGFVTFRRSAQNTPPHDGSGAVPSKIPAHDCSNRMNPGSQMSGNKSRFGCSSKALNLGMFFITSKAVPQPKRIRFARQPRIINGTCELPKYFPCRQHSSTSNERRKSSCLNNFTPPSCTSVRHVCNPLCNGFPTPRPSYRSGHELTLPLCRRSVVSCCPELRRNPINLHTPMLPYSVSEVKRRWKILSNRAFIAGDNFSAVCTSVVCMGTCLGLLYAFSISSLTSFVICVLPSFE